jgi:hypothetical protein
MCMVWIYIIGLGQGILVVIYGKAIPLPVQINAPVSIYLLKGERVCWLCVRYIMYGNALTFFLSLINQAIDNKPFQTDIVK